jgi:hypothetical protein
MTSIAFQHSQQIYQSATPALQIQGINGKRWKKNVAKGGRIDPWLQAKYSMHTLSS